MFCAVCGARIEEGDQFCGRCGSLVSEDVEFSRNTSNKQAASGTPAGASGQGSAPVSQGSPAQSPAHGSTWRYLPTVSVPKPDPNATRTPSVAPPEPEEEKPSILLPVLVGLAVTISVILIGFILIWALGYGYIFTGGKSTSKTTTSVKQDMMYEGGEDPDEVTKVVIEDEETESDSSDSNSSSTDTAPVKQVSSSETVAVSKVETNPDGSISISEPSGSQGGGTNPGANGNSGDNKPQNPNNQGTETEKPNDSGNNPGSDKKSEYIFPDSDRRLLTEEEIKKHSNWDLYIGRNEIYARHGRGFKNKDLQDYFNTCSWYVRKYDPDDFDENLLNGTEKKNSAAILEVERSRNSPYIS